MTRETHAAAAVGLPSLLLFALPFFRSKRETENNSFFHQEILLSTMSQGASGDPWRRWLANRVREGVLEVVVVLVTRRLSFSSLLSDLSLNQAKNPNSSPTPSPCPSPTQQRPSRALLKKSTRSSTVKPGTSLCLGSTSSERRRRQRSSSSPTSR